jgi:hydrogenase expression/formation protein HypE
MILICAAESAPEILKRWRDLPEGAGATRLGTVSRDKGRVVLETLAGGRRLVDVPRGELLPRIC